MIVIERITGRLRLLSSILAQSSSGPFIYFLNSDLQYFFKSNSYLPQLQISSISLNQIYIYLNFRFLFL